MLIVPHELITEESIKDWGYVSSVHNAYVNWNGVWLRKIGNTWEFGNPNHHTIDESHPFIKQGEVKYMDELNTVQKTRRAGT